MKKRKLRYAMKVFSVFILAGVAVQNLSTTDVSAFSSDQNIKANVVKVGDNTSGIEEKFDPPETVHPNTSYEKTVIVRNHSDTPCYVRVFVEKDQAEIPVTINFDTKNWTQKQKDGYYYYRTVLRGKEATEPLFTNVTTGEAGSPFRILVYEETVQANGHQTPEEAFAAIQGEQESEK